MGSSAASQEVRGETRKGNPSTSSGVDQSARLVGFARDPKPFAISLEALVNDRFVETECLKTIPMSPELIARMPL